MVRTCEQPFPVWPVICVIYQPVCDTAQQKRLERNVLSKLSIQFPLSSGLATASRALSTMIILSIILIPEPFIFIYLVLNSYHNGFPIVMIYWVKGGSLFLVLKPSARSLIFLLQPGKLWRAAEQDLKDPIQIPLVEGQKDKIPRMAMTTRLHVLQHPLQVSRPLCGTAVVQASDREDDARNSYSEQKKLSKWNNEKNQDSHSFCLFGKS